MPPSLLIGGMLALVLWSCSSPPAAPAPYKPIIDECGCVVPPPDVFTQLGLRVDIAQLSWEGVVLGSAGVEESPAVIRLVSEAAADHRLRDYLKCRAVNNPKNSPAMRAYTLGLVSFMETQPTPDEFIGWYKENPPPGIGTDKGGSRVADLSSVTPPTPGAPSASVGVLETESYRVTVDKIQKAANTVRLTLSFECVGPEAIRLVWRYGNEYCYLVDEDGDRWYLKSQDDPELVANRYSVGVEVVPGAKYRTRLQFVGDEVGNRFTLICLEAKPTDGRKIIIRNLESVP